MLKKSQRKSYRLNIDYSSIFCDECGSQIYAFSGPMMSVGICPKCKKDCDLHKILKARQRSQKSKQNTQFNLSKRFRVMQRDGFQCQICGNTAKDGARLEVDHKRPKSRGGTSSEDNLWTLCFDCNRGKAAKLLQRNQ